MAEVTKKKHPAAFKPGVSGNPNGRPKGSRNKETMAALALLRGEAQELTRVCIDRAKEGDIQALKLCLDRICPPTKDHPFDVTLPKVNSTDDLPKFTSAILESVADGTLPPSEAEKISKIAAIHQQSIQLSEFDKRLASIETLIKEKLK